jgi:hypothetical protein
MTWRGTMASIYIKYYAVPVLTVCAVVTTMTSARYLVLDTHHLLPSISRLPNSTHRYLRSRRKDSNEILFPSHNHIFHRTVRTAFSRMVSIRKLHNLRSLPHYHLQFHRTLSIPRMHHYHRPIISLSSNYHRAQSRRPLLLAPRYPTSRRSKERRLLRRLRQIQSSKFRPWVRHSSPRPTRLYSIFLTCP